MSSGQIFMELGSQRYLGHRMAMVASYLASFELVSYGHTEPRRSISKILHHVLGLHGMGTHRILRELASL